MLLNMSDRPRYASVPVPFVRIGNRRALTDKQLMEDEGLADFIARFPDSFERSEMDYAWLFVEPEMKNADPA